MLIPGQLTVVLERLFGIKLKGCLVDPPPLEKRIEIYIEALAYVEKDLSLFAYVLGHRPIVTEDECEAIDDILLECICRDPRIIPKHFRLLLPKYSRIAEFMTRLYMRDKEYKKFCPEPAGYQLAAE